MDILKVDGPLIKALPTQPGRFFYIVFEICNIRALIGTIFLIFIEIKSHIMECDAFSTINNSQSLDLFTIYQRVLQRLFCETDISFYITFFSYQGKIKYK